MEMEWKASRRYTSPFGALQIGRADADELEALAHVFVAEGIRNYERFLLEQHSRVDETQWKFMYEQENMRSFAERRKHGGGGGPSSRSDSSTLMHDHGSGASEDVPMHLNTPASDMPIVLVAGSIVGELDDTIYGYVCPTLDMMRTKTAYIKDGVYRACVLATLVAPTAEDPFRSLTVKWIERRNPLHLHAIVRNRDYVYMESTGVEYLRNGERVGYQLVHSVQFPQTPPRSPSIRGNMSMCAIYRQKDHKLVDVYLKGFLNPAGGIMRSIVTRAAARGLLAVSQHVQCAYLKKLAWAIRQHRSALGQSTTDVGSARSGAFDAAAVMSSAAPDRVAEGNAEMICVTCSKKKSAASKMLPGGKSMARRTCRLCHQYVCQSCRIEKKLFFMLADRRLVQQTVRCCVACFHRALLTKTMAVARHEVVCRADMYGWSEPSGHSGSSSAELSIVDDLDL